MAPAGTRDTPPREDAYPPVERTLTLDGEAGRLEVVVTWPPEGRVGTTDGDEPAARLFRNLDLATTDMLVAATRSVLHDGSEPWRRRIGDVLLSVERQAAILSLERRRRFAPLQARHRPTSIGVTTVSLALALEHYREFLAAGTVGEHHDVVLRVNGVPQTHRMARAADGSVQLVQHAWWSEVTSFLSDLQDVDVIGFFLEELHDVADGKEDECATGTNATTLVIRRDSCDLSHFWHSETVSLDTKELRDELVKLRAFAAAPTSESPVA